MRGESAKETPVIRAVSEDEEGRKRVEKAVLNTRNPETLRYIERKLHEKGIQRMERHPVDGLSLALGPPKSGHGGKFTWEGPMDLAEAELYAAPPAIDPNDPNYVHEEEKEEEAVVGEVDVAKAAEAKEGVSRIEVLPPLLP